MSTTLSNLRFFIQILTLSLAVSFLAGCDLPIEEPTTDTMDTARRIFREKKYEEAISALKQVDTPAIKTSEYYLILGTSYYKTGDFLKAIEALEDAKPKSLEVKIYIAYLYLLSGNSKDAEKISTTLLSEYGNLSNIYLLKGNIKLKKGNYTDALLLFKKTSDLDRTSVKAVIGMANTFFFQRNFVKAEEFYLKAVYMSDTPGTYISLSNFYKRLRRYEDAENNIKIALKTYPENRHLLLALLNIHLKRNNEKEALKLLENLLEFFPDSLELKVKKIKTLLILGKADNALKVIEQLQGQFGKKTPYYILLLKGEYHLRKGDMKQALYIFNNAFAKNPSSYETNYFLGLLNISKGNLRSARQYLEKSISIFPGFIQSHILLSYVYLSEKKYTLATEHCKIVLHLEPDNEAAHSLNGLSLFMQGLVNEAKYEFDVVRSINPENIFASYMTLREDLKSKTPETSFADKNIVDTGYIERLLLEFEILEQLNSSPARVRRTIKNYLEESPSYLAYLLSGLYFEKKGDSEFAANLYEKAVRSDNASVLTYYKLAETRHKQGDNTSAKKLLLQAIRISEYFIKPYRALGGLYEEDNDFESAKEIYTRGLSLFPEDPLMLNNLGWITLTYFKDKSSAYPYIREAVTLQPENPNFMDSIAWWYFESHDYRQAITTLKKTIRLSPADPLFHYHLGLAYKENGDEQLASSHLKKAISMRIAKKYKENILRVLGE